MAARVVAGHACRAEPGRDRADQRDARQCRVGHGAGPGHRVHDGKASRPVTATITIAVRTFTAAWSATTKPIPAGAAGASGVEFSSAACASASRCVGVGTGYPGTTGQTQAVLVAGSGSLWKAMKVPLPAGVSGVLDSSLVSASCAPAGECAAIGTYSTKDGQRHGLLVTSSASSWTATEVPPPANVSPTAVTLVSVACPASGECVAAGNYWATTGNEVGLLLEQSGATWRAVQAPTPANAASGYYAATQLTAVACLVATRCAATGTYVDSSAQEQFLMLSESGSAWTATGVAPPANAYTAATGGSNPLDPVAMACSPAACTAAGDYTSTSPDGTYDTYVLTLVGGSWTALQTPPPGLTTYTPTSIACMATPQCDIAGYEWTTTGALAFGSGSSWAALLPPLPISDPASQSEMLFSIACPPGPAALPSETTGASRPETTASSSPERARPGRPR